jgi:hypothetical protein
MAMCLAHGFGTGRGREELFGVNGRLSRGERLEDNSDDIARFERPEILGTCDAIVVVVGAQALLFRGKADVTALGQALGEPL